MSIILDVDDISTLCAINHTTISHHKNILHKHHRSNQPQQSCLNNPYAHLHHFYQLLLSVLISLILASKSYLSYNFYYLIPYTTKIRNLFGYAKL